MCSSLPHLYQLFGKSKRNRVGFEPTTYRPKSVALPLSYLFLIILCENFAKKKRNSTEFESAFSRFYSDALTKLSYLFLIILYENFAKNKSNSLSIMPKLLLFVSFFGFLFKFVFDLISKDIANCHRRYSSI